MGRCRKVGIVSEKKCFRTLQLHRVVGAVHVSAQCNVPRIYEHQAWSHIHLDSHISAPTCSVLTSTNFYSPLLKFSYLLISRWSNANQLFLISTQHSSRIIDSYIPADANANQHFLISTQHSSRIKDSYIPAADICSHQLISAQHFSYLLTSSCSNFLIYANIFSRLLTSGHFCSDFRLLAVTHTHSHQLTFTQFWQHSSRKWFVCMACHD